MKVCLCHLPRSLALQRVRVEIHALTAVSRQILEIIEFDNLEHIVFEMKLLDALGYRACKETPARNLNDAGMQQGFALHLKVAGVKTSAARRSKGPDCNCKPTAIT